MACGAGERVNWGKITWRVRTRVCVCRDSLPQGKWCQEGEVAYEEEEAAGGKHWGQCGGGGQGEIGTRVAGKYSTSLLAM